jgi:hypothetical protein
VLESGEWGRVLETRIKKTRGRRGEGAGALEWLKRWGMKRVRKWKEGGGDEIDG